MLLSIFGFVSLFAQQAPFQKALGSSIEDYASEMQTTSDNGFILTANSSIGDSTISRTIKLDSNMTVVWDKTFENLSQTYISDVAQLENGQFVFSGNISGYSSNNKAGGWLMKTDNKGTPIWSKRVKTEGYENIEHVFGKSNGDVLSVGRNFSSAPIATIATRFAADGTFQNAFTLKKDNTVAIQTAYMRQLANNSFVIAGGLYGSYNKLVVVKFKDDTETPTADWSIEYSSSNYSSLEVFDMKPDQDNNVYLACRASFVSSSSQHILIVKLSSVGEIIWIKNIAAPTDTYNSLLITSLIPTATDVTIVGSLYTKTFTSYAFTAKLTNDGTPIWARRIGDKQNETFNKVLNPSKHGFNILGTSNRGIESTGSNLYLLKMDSIGRSGGCFTDTLLLSTTDATLSKTSFMTTFPSIDVTVETDTMRIITKYPLSTTSVCSQQTCTPPADPITLFGTAECTTTLSIKTLPTLNWRKTAELYNVYIYEASSTQAVWKAICVTDTFVKPNFELQEGLAYKWNVVAVKGSCNNIECTSSGNNFKYFSKAFAIYKNDTAYTCGTVSLSTNIIPNGTYEWFKDNERLLDIYSALYQPSEPGEYKLRLAISVGGTTCPNYKIESAPVFLKKIPVFPLIVKADTSTICPDKTIKLIASGSPSGFYRWSSDRIYANTTNQGDSVATVIVPKDALGVYVFFTSSSYQECSVTQRTDLVISPKGTPAVNIAIAEGCPSKKLTFTATAINGGTEPTFVWYRNTDSIGVGKTFIYENAKNQDKITAKMTIGQGICTDKMTAVSDTTTISCINTGINDVEGFENYKVFPNPSSGIFEVQLSLEKSAAVSFRIKNTLGQIVYQKHPLSIKQLSEQIDLSSQPKGLYSLEIWVDGKVLIQKMIIE